MAVVGSAEIIVRAITSKVKDDIQKAFKDARPAIQAEGKQAGKDYAKSFGDSLRQNLGPALSGAFQNSGAQNAAGKAGQDAGRQFATSFQGQVDSMNLGSAGEKAGKDFADGLSDSLDGEMSDVSSDIEAEMGNAGRRGGNAMGRGFLNSEFSNSARAASKKFTVLLGIGNLVSAAIGTLVSSLAAAVSGLFAMGAAASQAASALAVFPSLIGVAVQGFAALKLAMSGIGEAIGAGTKAADAIDETGGAAASNAYAIADAKKALSRAYQDAADAAADAADRVSDAERDVADAQREVLGAQRELNAARREAAETLQQLAFDAEGAALAEERAGIRLEEAFAKLQAAQKLPADDKARREAELSYKEAELAFRQAKDRNSDLAKEQKKAAKAGVDGSKEVIDAKEKINSEQQRLAEAEERLADARLAQARQDRDSTEAIADAQERLRRAIEASASAQSKAASAADEYNKALSKLSKPARSFVEYVVSLQDEFQKLKQSAGLDFFPQLETAMRNTVTRTFPLLGKELRVSGDLLGNFALDASEAINSVGGFKHLTGILRGNNAVLKIFTTENENGRSAVGSLVKVVLRLLHAIQPVTRRFARWIASMLEAADVATTGEKKMEKLRQKFKAAGDVAATLGSIVGNLWGAIRELGKAATPAGTDLLESFEAATASLEKMVRRARKSGDLGKYFKGASKNLKAIGNLINTIGLEFFKLGDNQGVKGFAEALEPAIENFGKVGDELTAAGPAFGEFIFQISELFVALTQGGGLTKFIENLTWVVEKINAVVSSEFGQKVLGWAAMIAAFTRVIGLVLLPISFLFKAIVGGPIAVIRSLSRLRRSLSGLVGYVRRIPAAFRVLRNGGGLRGAFAAIRTGSDQAKAALERQMVTDKKKVQTLRLLERQAQKTATALQAVKVAGAPAAAAGAGAAGAGAKAGAGAAAAGAGATAAPGRHRGKGLLGRRLAGRNEGGFVAPGGGADKAVKTAGKRAATTTTKMGKLGSVMGKLAKGPFKLLGSAFMLLGRGLLAVLGPIGLVILAGYGLFKFFQALYKHSPAFREFVDNIVEKLRQFGDWAKRIFMEYVVPAMDSFFKKVNEVLPKIGKFFGSVFGKIWDIAKSVFGFFKKHWKTIGAILLGPIGIAAALIIKHWDKIKAAAFKLRDKVRDAVEKLKEKWQSFKDKISSIVDSIKKKWDVFKAGLQVLKDFFAQRIENIKHNFGLIFDAVALVVSKVKDKWGEFADRFERFKETLKGKIDKVKDFFSGIGDTVKEVFSNLKDYAAIGVNNFIAFLNKNLIGNLNKVTSKFGLTIPEIPEMADGGRVTGRGGPREDNQLRALSVGEQVIKTASARRVGYDVLDYINRTGQLPDPRGGSGPRGPIGGSQDGVGGLGAWLKKGAGYALDKLVDAFQSTLGVVGLSKSGSGFTLTNFFHGILDKLGEVARSWGAGKDEAAAAATSAFKTPGIGPGPYHRPLGRYAISQGYTGPYPAHSGIDLAAPTGTGVYAVTKAVVATMMSSSTSYGRHMKLVADGYNLLYAHLNSFAPGLKVGSRLSTGSYLGGVGSTGNSTGPHLHFEVRPGAGGAHNAIDPLEWLRKRGVKLAQGGTVQATPGGVLSVIGEAGRNERVEPLDRQGLSRRDRALVELIREATAQGGKGDVFNVYGAPGMTEAELAKYVAREIKFVRRRGRI